MIQQGTWSTGADQEMSWLQLIASRTALLTFKRRHGIKNVEILLHKIAPSANEFDEIPCYAEFSLEVRNGDEIIAADGVGFLLEMTDGSVGFSTGSAVHDGDLEVFHPVLRKLKQGFTIWVNDLQFDFDITEKAPLLEIFGVSNE